jgi:hypothetical protein
MIFYERRRKRKENRKTFEVKLQFLRFYFKTELKLVFKAPFFFLFFRFLYFIYFCWILFFMNIYFCINFAIKQNR